MSDAPAPLLHSPRRRYPARHRVTVAGVTALSLLAGFATAVGLTSGEGGTRRPGTSLVAAPGGASPAAGQSGGIAGGARTSSPGAPASAAATPTSISLPSPTAPSASGPGPSPGSSAFPSGPGASVPPTAAPAGAAFAAAIRLERVGLGAGGADVPRYLVFGTDGAGFVRATLPRVTGGPVRLCVFRGRPAAPTTRPLCFVAGFAGGFVRGVARGGSSDWTVSVEPEPGAQAAVSDLLVEFPTRSPRVEFEGFPFAGTSADGSLNGIQGVVHASRSDALVLQGSWPTGAAVPLSWSAELSTTGGQILVRQTGQGDSAGTGTTVTAGGDYRFKLRNEGTDAPAGATLRASVAWP